MDTSFDLDLNYFPPASCSTTLLKATEKLKELGYGFNDRGFLCKLDPKDPSGQKLTETRFNFVVHQDDPTANQKHYEQVGDIITQYVYGLLESEPFNFQKIPVGGECDGDRGHRSFFYASSDYAECEHLMVFIHGNGVVRAGQWARRLIINNSIHIGTQLPFIYKAMTKGFGILVMNTNDNGTEDNPIVGCEDALQHATTTWDQYILGTKARMVAVLAHSYGGVVAVYMTKMFRKYFIDRVFAVILTDSVHLHLVKGTEFLVQVGVNYVASHLPINALVKRKRGDDEMGDETNARTPDITCRSAGHPLHEWTSWSSYEYVWKCITFLYRKAVANQSVHGTILWPCPPDWESSDDTTTPSDTSSTTNNDTSSSSNNNSRDRDSSSSSSSSSSGANNGENEEKMDF